jgi:3-hydroxyacyl-CoA dehydrogenase
MDYVDANGAGLVIGNQAGGMPGAFSAGGDLAFMAELAKAGKYARNRRLSEKSADRHAERFIIPASLLWRHRTA